MTRSVEDLVADVRSELRPVHHVTPGGLKWSVSENALRELAALAKARMTPHLPEFEYRPVEPCGMDCGNIAPGIYVWAWGEGDHRTERNICAECVVKGKPEFAPILDATPAGAREAYETYKASA